MENFRDIPKYEGHYQVSDLGRVKSLKCGKERILKHGVDTHGYPFVILHMNKTRRTLKIHQLVAITFLGYVRNGKQDIVVDHIDSNKQNNNLTNLQLITQRENTQKRKSSSKYAGVSYHSKSKKWRSQIRIGKDRKHLGYFKTELGAYLHYVHALEQLLTKIK